eukprot:4528789-Amphidinium_carterae.1
MLLVLLSVEVVACSLFATWIGLAFGAPPFGARTCLALLLRRLLSVVGAVEDLVALGLPQQDRTGSPVAALDPGAVSPCSAHGNVDCKSEPPPSQPLSQQIDGSLPPGASLPPAGSLPAIDSLPSFGDSLPPGDGLPLDGSTGSDVAVTQQRDGSLTAPADDPLPSGVSVPTGPGTGGILPLLSGDSLPSIGAAKTGPPQNVFTGHAAAAGLWWCLWFWTRCCGPCYC